MSIEIIPLDGEPVMSIDEMIESWKSTIDEEDQNRLKSSSTNSKEFIE